MYENYSVTEVCPNCEREITMIWDIDDLGYKAFCPVCGEQMMLCDACIHSEDGLNENCNHCDWQEHDDGTSRCFRCGVERRMVVEFLPVSDKDRKEFEESLGSARMLDGCTKVVVTTEEGDNGYCFMEDKVIEKLEKPYIESHAELRYSTFLEQWNVKVSENDFYNDLEKYPEKEIRLTFCGVEAGTGREIYKGIDSKRYYLREVHYPREDFAKWLVCGSRRFIDDGDEPRANLVFVLDGQKEKVRYDDWNGVAAYPDTFNRDFNRTAKK